MEQQALSAPTWLSNKTVCLIETTNGYAIAPNPTAQVSECVVFESFPALVVYLEANFSPRP